jgi:hypothetical protein
MVKLVKWFWEGGMLHSGDGQKLTPSQAWYKQASDKNIAAACKDVLKPYNPNEKQSLCNENKAIKLANRGD